VHTHFEKSEGATGFEPSPHSLAGCACDLQAKVTSVSTLFTISD